DVKYISFQEVKSLKLNKVSEETVFFTKNALLPQKMQADNKNCGCDLSSPSYIAAMTLNSNGDIITMNMVGSQIYISRADGRVQTVGIENANKAITEQSLFARMATTPDGSVYALNNDGTQLIKFTKDEQIVLLGAVEGFASIFTDNAEKRASYGGDMIADTEGNLLVFTAFGYVIKINPKTVTAEYVGQISGLPEGYTVNGAAVADDNSIVLASSQPKGIYSTDINTLTASFTVENTTPTYDLASRNFLKSKLQPNSDITLSLSPTMIKKGNAFFNIVSNKEINDISVTIYGMDGKLVLKNAKNLDAGTNKIDINGIMSGVYLVSVSDLSGNKLLTDKITVE
ncbi:MAG: T9SS type A sorting domain-containing protein, partial [Paludibacter sp.]|nr:T9SS type A sorting domain-containing protein [Paludibacter sp.]